jgi:hypothetical protein
MKTVIKMSLLIFLLAIAVAEQYKKKRYFDSTNNQPTMQINLYFDLKSLVSCSNKSSAYTNYLLFINNHIVYFLISFFFFFFLNE